MFQKTDVGDSGDVEECVKKAVELGNGRLDMQVFPFYCSFLLGLMYYVGGEGGGRGHQIDVLMITFVK